ncbi:hypothetical protein BH10PSE19_BH10PSE19_18610 [soil metagenome]
MQQIKKNTKIMEIISHLTTEEKDAEKTIKELKKIDNEEEWEEKFSILKEDVEHHASEEEEKLFQIVEKLFDETTLEEIGKEMLEFKKNYNHPE